MWVWFSFKLLVNLCLMSELMKGILSRIFSFFCGSLFWMCCWNSVYKWGIEMNRVGWCILIFLIKVLRDFGNVVSMLLMIDELKI